MFRALLLRGLVVALAFGAAPARAAIFSVGTNGDCTHTTLQAALDAAANNSGADVVRIVDRSWTAIQVSTDTSQAVEISGGWATCSSSAPTTKTTLSGAGGQARSVISLRGNANFTLRNLRIEGGDQAGDDDGGGIHFFGGGILRIENTEISGNSADEGGGIYAHGTSPTAELILGADVQVSNNTARQHGGGVVAQAIEMSMIEPGSVLFMNIAGGYGGGLMVRSGEFGSYAYIGTGGIGDLGAIYGNQARRGGGISVFGGTDSGRNAEVHVFSTDAARVQRIRSNTASERGGGIDLQPDGDFGSGRAEAFAQLRNTAIEDNSAPVGAAINLDYDAYGVVNELSLGGAAAFNLPLSEYNTDAIAMHPAAGPCPVARPCGYIRNNTTSNLTGAVLQLSDNADFFGSRLALEGNTGGWLAYLSGEEFTTMQLAASLIVGNSVQNALIRDDQNHDGDYTMVDLNYLTIAGNTLGANGVLSTNDGMVLTRSIVDQPGKRLIATDVGATGGTYTMQQNVVSTTPLPAGAVYGPGRFVDAEDGDYTPRAGSRAADFAAPSGSFAADLHGRNRNVDLVGNPDEFGVADAGAIEREYLDPLVQNSEFDTDVRLWNLAPANWDATQDRDGDAASGAAKVIYEPGIGGGDGVTPIAVNSQCIHLPGPGVYELNGHGRLSSGAPGVRARLRWELRLFGGLFGCEDGAPDLTGVHLLATGTAWTRPGTSSQIVVPEAAWSVDSSLTIQLDVLGAPVGTTTGWFDGIELVKTDDPPSSNANAANIVTTAGPLVPGFSADTSDYAVATDDASATVRVDAQVQSSAITVNGIVVSSGVSSPAIALAPGPNTVTVRITAPDAVTVKTYVLTITRSGGSSSLFADGFED